MSWQTFIRKLEKDFRINGSEIEKKTGIHRDIIYKMRSGTTIKPLQKTIRKLEDGLCIRIDDTDPDHIKYSQNLFDKNIELFNIEATQYPIVSRIRPSSEIFIPQNIIGTVAIPFAKKINCFAVIVSENDTAGIYSKNDKLLLDMDADLQNGCLAGCILKSGEQLIRYYMCLPEGYIQLYTGRLHDEPVIIKENMTEALYRVVLSIQNR
ncbi:MAG: hypothetical protein ACM3Q2_03405 [Syntrophothermus sp.]